MWGQNVLARNQRGTLSGELIRTLNNSAPRALSSYHTLREGQQRKGDNITWVRGINDRLVANGPTRLALPKCNEGRGTRGTPKKQPPMTKMSMSEDG